MAKYDWKIEPRDEDWSDDLYGYFLIRINLKKMTEYLTKEFKKDWWFKANFGQDYVWIVAENNNFPVRLFFNFDEGGWVNVVRHYIDGSSYNNTENLRDWYFAKYNIDDNYFRIEDIIENYFNEFEESMKESKKSIKEYRTVGFEQLVRDTIVEVLEDSHLDLFDLGVNDGIITYDNKGRARITSNGDIDMNYLTLPTYFWSSGYTPSNKKTAKLVDNIIDMNMESARERLWYEYKDELIELGITDKDDEKLNYSDLSNMGADDLAEELSEYEMDGEGTELFTDVYCELEETDEGIELTVSMIVQDEYGHALVKDYKSNTVLLDENKLQDLGDLTEVIEKAIREVTEQF